MTRRNFHIVNQTRRRSDTIVLAVKVGTKTVGRLRKSRGSQHLWVAYAARGYRAPKLVGDFVAKEGTLRALIKELGISKKAVVDRLKQLEAKGSVTLPKGKRERAIQLHYARFLA